MKPQSLVAFDVDHIKDYVFSTDPLNEIRGASSLLDRLNRNVMVERAASRGGEVIYANGGSGLFLIDFDQAEAFGVEVQQEYRQLTAKGASVTYVVQPLPEDAPNTREEIKKYPMPSTLALLRHRLREQKGNPYTLGLLRHRLREQQDNLSTHTTAASHPLMRLCDSCGIFYAVKFASREQQFYCQSCVNKQDEDERVKKYLELQPEPKNRENSGDEKEQPRENFVSPIWEKVRDQLISFNYPLRSGTERPQDLNVFGEFGQAKDYLGLIYADANGMGRKIEECETLQEVEDFAKKIDNAVYWAMSSVVSDHLPLRQSGDSWVFPFDILLIGGDDIVLVTPAAQAMTVAHALAKRFYEFANGEWPDDNKPVEQKPDHKEAIEEKKKKEKHTLSVGVVLAPTNYPFSLLLELAEDTLKFAKKDGSKIGKDKKSDYGKTRINFLVVTGSTSLSFSKVYASWYKRYKTYSCRATMRPYTLEQLEFLLAMLQEGNRRALGRSKLQQLREAVLHLNRSTSVTESLAVLRSWKEKERNFVVQQVYSTERNYPLTQWDDETNPAARFPTVTFPWVVNDNKEKGMKEYNTLLFDFADLYDFVAREEGGGHDKD